MPNRSHPSAMLLLALAATSLVVGCRQSRPGDSGGAATGDSLAAPGTGSARSNESLEHRRPADTTLPSRIHGERGRDTATH
jgi:hypothetical protein